MTFLCRKNGDGLYTRPHGHAVEQSTREENLSVGRAMEGVKRGKEQVRTAPRSPRSLQSHCRGQAPSVACWVWEHPYKGIEEIVGINRPRGRFWMKLHAHKGADAMPDPLVGAIVGVDKPRLPARRQGGVVHGIAVVLRGNVTALCPDFQTWLILAPVPEFELIGVGPGCQGEQLMA